MMAGIVAITHVSRKRIHAHSSLAIEIMGFLFHVKSLNPRGSGKCAMYPGTPVFVDSPNTHVDCALQVMAIVTLSIHTLILNAIGMVEIAVPTLVAPGTTLVVLILPTFVSIQPAFSMKI